MINIPELSFLAHMQLQDSWKEQDLQAELVEQQLPQVSLIHNEARPPQACREAKKSNDSMFCNETHCNGDLLTRDSRDSGCAQIHVP